MIQLSLWVFPFSQSFSKPLSTKLQYSFIEHPFLVLDHCPVTILGRDPISCSPEGFQVASPQLGLFPALIQSVLYRGIFLN